MEENSNGSTYGKFVFISNKMKVCLTNSIGPKSSSDVAMKWNCVINFHPHHRAYCGLYMLHAHVHRIVCMLQALFYHHATTCSRFVYAQWLWQSNMYVKIKSLFLLSCTHVLSTYQWFFAPLFRLIYSPFSSRKCRKTISLFTVL